MEEVTFRPACLEDAPVLLEIYRPYVDKTPFTFEYIAPSPEEFRGRMEGIMAKYPYIVAESGGRPVGYSYASAFRTRPAYGWAVESSIYVKEGLTGMGIGKLLMAVLEKILISQNIVNIYACITYPNPQSISFHEKLGYKTIGHFTGCGYKNGSWLDMIWMEKHLGGHSSNPPAPVISFPELLERTRFEELT